MKKLLACCLMLSVLLVHSAQSQSIISTTGKTSFTTKTGSWTLQQYAPNVVKATFSPAGYTANENISDAVVAKPLNTIVKQWHESKSPNRSIQWKDFMVEVQGAAISFGANKAVTITATYQDSVSRGFQLQLQEGEKIFGGGERALPLNRRGYRFNLYNNPWYGYSEGADNLNYSVPFFTSSKGYGLFFDNPSKGYADIGKTDTHTFQVGFTSGELTVYIILGKDYKEILRSYHQLTGTQPLPPRWALGNLMSRFGYTSEAQVKDILGKMKAEGVPVDAVIFDLFWFGDSIKGTMGNLDWVNRKAWPHPKQMIADFRKDNINTILITEPFVLKSSLNYNQSKPFQAVDSLGKPYLLTDFYFGESGLIDIFRKDAQQWFWSKHKVQMDNGVEAWWGDLGEPEKHPSNLYHNLRDLGFKRLFQADEVHNLYGHTWTKMLYNSYAEDYPNKRLFSLNRSGFAGSQRYGIFPWTGDVSRSWSGLRSQLQVLLGMSMSGVPYVHSDAGGFAGGEGDNELYIRWLQMAAFTPIFRPHGTALYGIDKNAFSFPSEAALVDTPFKAIAKEIIGLRYALLPYNYTLAYQQATYGKPLIAPLYYHYPNDTAATRVEDEFMWGENILVAPVLNKGAYQRDVYLPEGKWYQFASYKQLSGNAWVKEKVALNQCAAYIKEGTFLAMQALLLSNMANAGSYNNQLPIITYFPSSSLSKYVLYMDDGVNKHAIEQGQYKLINFTGITKGKKVLIDIASPAFNYYQKDNNMLMTFMLPFNIKEGVVATVNGKKIIPSRIGRRSCSVDFSGSPVHIEFELE